VRDAEREILFSEFKHREGELISGIVRRQERGNIVVDLGKADAIMYRREVIPGENYNSGDRIQAYLSEVVMTQQGPEIRLSRTSPLFLVKLFETEVPEIADGVIEVKSAAREPGQRAKLAVKSNDKEIDPVGACVGMKGARVQSIVNELQGEKIDIVRWYDDLDPFIREALKPAAIYDINIRSANCSVDVIVEDTQLSLAIGRRGQNVRLAAMLTGLKINIISKIKLQEKIKKSFDNLAQLTFLNNTSSQILIQSGIMNIATLVTTPAATIASVLSIDEALANDYLKGAKELLESGSVVAEPLEDEDIVSATADPVYKGALLSGVDNKQKAESDKNKFT
jgi:N utilization substance protein A